MPHWSATSVVGEIPCKLEKTEATTWKSKYVFTFMRQKSCNTLVDSGKAAQFSTFNTQTKLDLKSLNTLCGKGGEAPHPRGSGTSNCKNSFYFISFCSLDLSRGFQQNLLQYQLCWESKPGPSTLPHTPNHSCPSSGGCSSSKAQVFILQDKKHLSLKYIAYFLVLLYMTDAFAQQSF